MVNKKEVYDVDEFLKNIEEKKKGSEEEIVEEPEKKEALLTEALDELDKELIKLKEERKSLEKHLESVSEDMNFTHDEELKLRKKITEFVEKEVQFNTSKDNLKKELSKVQKKISRISEIRDELEEV